MLKNTLPLDSEFTNSSPLDSPARFNMIYEKGGDKFHCKFCDIQINENEIVKHAESHVMIPWDRVSNAYDKYEIFFENSILHWKDLFRCCLCKITFDEWSVALVHITDKLHRSLTEDRKIKMSDDFVQKSNVTFEFLVAEGLFALDLKTFRCVICEVQNVAIGQINRHVKGLVHSWKKKKFSLDSNETEKIVTQEISIENSENSSEKGDFPISGETNNCLSIADSFWIVEKEWNSFQCVVCNCIFPNTLEALNIHLMGIYHRNSKKRYGCSHIVRQNGRFYCEICNHHMIIDENVRLHVRITGHVDSLLGIEEKTMGQENPEKASSTDNSLPRKKMTDDIPRNKMANDLPRKKMADDLPRNKMADDQLRNKMEDDQPRNEIADDQPRNKMADDRPRNKMEDDQSRNKMEDDQPKIKMADDRPRNKMEDDQSRNKMEDDQPKIKMADDLLENKMEDKPKNNNENKVEEEVDTSLIKIGKISLQENHPKFGDWITKVNDIKARCEMCNCAVSPLIHNIDIHVMGKTHALSLRRHGCEYISMRKNNYHCDCCDIDMSNVEEIYQHVRSKEHAKMLDSAMQRKILEVKKNISTVRIGDKVLENFKISKNLEVNVDNQFFEDSLNVGQCDPHVIDVREDHQYHCNCCDRTICGIDNLIQHCNGKRHLAAYRSSNRSID